MQPGSTSSQTVGVSNTIYVMKLSTEINKNPDTVLTIDDIAQQIYLAPTTTATLSAIPNTNGWNKANVNLKLTAVSNSNGSIVKQITYSASGAQTIPSTTIDGKATEINITNEGQTTVSFYATDNFGNQEAVKTVTVKIDKTSPELNIQFDPKTLQFVGSGTDSLSGIDSYNQTVTSMNAKDKAGNTTQFIFTTSGNNLTKHIGAQTLTLNNMLYNNQSTTISKTILIAAWTTDSNNLLNHLVQTYAITGQSAVVGTYNDNNNKSTVLNITTGKTIQKSTAQGLDLIKLVSNLGKIKFVY